MSALPLARLDHRVQVSLVEQNPSTKAHDHDSILRYPLADGGNGNAQILRSLVHRQQLVRGHMPFHLSWEDGIRLDISQAFRSHFVGELTIIFYVIIAMHSPLRPRSCGPILTERRRLRLTCALGILTLPPQPTIPAICRT